MSGGGKKTWKLTVRLLKKGVGIDDALKGCPDLAEGKWRDIQGARVFSGTAYSGAPKWKELLRGGASQLGALLNRGAVALLFLPVKDRIMVVSFGMGHICLSPDSFERDFGLKVVLNTVERDKLKSLDVRTPEELTVQKRVQTSRQSEISAFGIDVERDILRSVTGKPKDPAFAVEVTGADSLIIHSKLDAADIHKKCDAILDAYNKTDYQQEFDWVDHIRSVRDPELMRKLDDKLFEHLLAARKAYAATRLHLAPPEVVDHASFGQIKYAGFRSRRAFTTLDIADYLGELNDHDNNDSIGDIKKKHWVKQAAEGSENFYRRWKIYDCFVFEEELDGKIYVLSSGQWYEISKAFADEINKIF